MIKPILVDRRNYADVCAVIIDKMTKASVVGVDIETDGRNAHPGILAFNDSNAVDLRRQLITGFSLYPDGDTCAYYINLNQKDAENRITWAEAKSLLDAKPKDILWIAHNAPYEIANLKAVYDYDIYPYICTLQMAVSAYNQDQYDKNQLFTMGLGGITKIIGEAAAAFSTFTDRNHMTSAQSEVFGQVVSKDSKANHSYNGLVKSVAYGYSLKQAVHSHFGYKMTTYKEVIGENRGMADLTGDEVVSYGADDAYWCVRLFHFLKEFMLKTNPEVLKTYLQQELPMVQVYADTWREGIKIDTASVESQRMIKRQEYATKLREMRKLLRTQLPFKGPLHEALAEADKLWASNGHKYRTKIEAWAKVDDSKLTDEQVIMSTGGAVSGGLYTDKGLVQPKSMVNFSYYLTIRTIMFDLFQQPLLKYKGSVWSDGEGQGRLKDRVKGDQKAILDLMSEMTTIQQAMGLYLNPYLQLIDPETNRIYPQLSSQLNTRRLAASFPNPMQLAKRGASTYVRGFYRADDDDSVIVSLDWSQFELVILGELSKDPEFAAAYSQLPFGDLHTGATVDCLQVTIPELTLDILKNLGKMSVKEINDINPKLLIDPSGKPIPPEKAKSFWRTSVGKGANFNYWYSGALSTVGDTLGWTSDQMWEATERYRTRFSVAEKWRVDTIRQLQRDGYLQLPDGHRRVRFEATPEWGQFMNGQFTQRGQLLHLPHKGLSTFGNMVTKSIQTRANNQGINALIQGTNAFCAKRSVIRIMKQVKELGLRVRFMMSVHDELVFSVHKGDAVEFINLARNVMRSHEDVFKTLKLDCTASVGKTFEPWHKDKAPLGQIELSEIQFDFAGVNSGGALDDKLTQKLIDEYLFA